jgi:hypothetical protein
MLEIIFGIALDGNSWREPFNQTALQGGERDRAALFCMTIPLGAIARVCADFRNGSGMAQHEPVARIEELCRNGWSGNCHKRSLVLWVMIDISHADTADTIAPPPIPYRSP